MSTAKNISEVIAWQLANQQSGLVFKLVEKGPCTRDRKYCKQIRDSAGAVAPMIAEGFVRFTPGEFAKYLRWARAEIAETQTHLLEGQSRGYFTEQQTTPVWRISKRLMRATSRLLKAKLAQIEEEKRVKDRKQRT